MAIVPALQGLGLGMDLAFPSTYGNLGIVRINTEIILGKLKKQTNQPPKTTKKKESALMSIIGVMKRKASLQIYTLLREKVMGMMNFRNTVEWIPGS